MSIDKFDPKKDPKYSNFIFRFLKNKIKLIEACVGFPRIVRFKDDLGWHIGWFIDSDFVGSRISYGNERVEVFCYIHLTEENVVKEVEWGKYERMGICALMNLNHRWIYANRKSRKCLYCGKWERKVVKTVKTVERRTLWESEL